MLVAENQCLAAKSCGVPGMPPQGESERGCALPGDRSKVIDGWRVKCAARRIYGVSYDSMALEL
jgi:hypothetical protein